MLDFDEIKDIARLKRLSLINTEKDYLQDLILFSLYSRLNKEIIFKGGTCLYKIYKLNRFSEDLDFTLTKNIDFKKLIPKLMKDISLLNINVKLKEFKKYKNEINIRFLFNSMLYKGTKESQCFIPLNISLKEKILSEPKKEILTSLYKEIPTFEVYAMNEKEILAEKIRAILTREKPRDIYDLWFLIAKRETPLDMNLINKKLKLYNISFSKDEFIKSINRKKGLWNLDLKNLIVSELPNFDIVRENIISKII